MQKDIQTLFFISALSLGLFTSPRLSSAQQMKGGGSGKERGPELCVKMTESVNKKLPALLLPFVDPPQTQAFTQSSASSKAAAQPVTDSNAQVTSTKPE